MIRPIDPDEAVAVNGVPVTGRMLAEARQQLAHKGAFLPTWAELPGEDQRKAAQSAAGWLRALAELVAEASSPERLAELDRADPLNQCGGCERYVPLDEAQPVPFTPPAPDGRFYRRWHPACVEAAKRDRAAAR